MPNRFTNSVPFKFHGWDFVQVVDASNSCWCLVPCDDPVLVQQVLDALNLWDRSQQIAPMVAQALGEVSNG